MIEWIPLPNLLSDQCCFQVSGKFRLGLESCAPQLSSDYPELENSAPKRVLEFLAGRTCAEKALALAGGMLSGRVGIGEDRAPIWPQGYVGSITHSSEWVAAVVARSETHQGLGVDVERVLDAASAEEIREVVLTPKERSRGAFQDPRTLSLVFSAKESVYKCLRPLTGCYIDFQDAEIDGIDEGTGTFDFLLLKNFSDVFTAGFRAQGRFTFFADHVLTAVGLAACSQAGEVA